MRSQELQSEDSNFIDLWFDNNNDDNNNPENKDVDGGFMSNTGK